MALWECRAGFPPPHEYAIGTGSAAGFQRAGMRLDGGQQRGLHANERGQDSAALPAGPGAGTGDGTGARLERGAEGPGVGRGGVGAPWLCPKEGA